MSSEQKMVIPEHKIELEAARKYYLESILPDMLTSENPNKKNTHWILGKINTNLSNDEYYKIVIDYGKALHVNNYKHKNTLENIQFYKELKLSNYFMNNYKHNNFIQALFYHNDYIYYFLDDENYPKYFKEIFEEIDNTSRKLYLNLIKQINFYEHQQFLNDVVYKWRILYRRLNNNPLNELNYEELSQIDDKLIEKYETAIDIQNQKQSYYENLDKKHIKEMNEFYLSIILS